MRPILELSGGIPLLMQLILSDVARNSWQRMGRFPFAFGPALLQFLYEDLWQDLRENGLQGILAQEILLWLADERYGDRRITHTRLARWAETADKSSDLGPALNLLHERFLIVNSDIVRGDYAVFPSLAEYLQHYVDR